MNEALLIVTKTVLVGTALAVSLMYASRLRHHARDPFRLALLGMLVATALSHLPGLVWLHGYMLHPLITSLLWVGSTALFLLATWPIVVDWWRVVVAWLKVGRDSWRVLNSRYPVRDRRRN